MKVVDLVKTKPTQQKSTHSDLPISSYDFRKIKLSFLRKKPTRGVTVGTPKINGKHNKSMQNVSLKINGKATLRGHGIPGLSNVHIPMYKEVLPGLESWKASKVTSWQSLGTHPVQWFCIVCIDRRGMMAEVTSALTAAGITIYSCVAEIDGRKGMGVMLFHIEGMVQNLVDACAGMDLILGVLGWSAGCSWASPSEDRHFLEC